VRYLREFISAIRAGLSIMLVGADEKRLHTFENCACHRRLALRHLGEHDHSYRHDRAQDRTVSPDISRPHRDAGEGPQRYRASEASGENAMPSK